MKTEKKPSPEEQVQEEATREQDSRNWWESAQFSDERQESER